MFFSTLSIEAFRLNLLGVFTMKISTHFPPTLRQRINEDMSLRKFAVKTQISYIRAINRLCEYLQHSPENTTREEREVLKKMATKIRQFAQDNDTQSSMAMNRTVHELEAGVAKNSMLEASLTLLQSMSRRFWFAFVKSKEQTVEGANLHATILEKIASANVDEAEAAANNLLLFLEGITKKQIKSAYSRHFGS